MSDLDMNICWGYCDAQLRRAFWYFDNLVSGNNINEEKASTVERVDVGLALYEPELTEEVNLAQKISILSVKTSTS